jgi:hypothetical protein
MFIKDARNWKSSDKAKIMLEVVWYPSFGPGILEFILEFHRWAVWLPQN